MGRVRRDGPQGHPPNIWDQERDFHRFASHYLPCCLEKYWLPIRVDYGRGETLEQFPIFPPHEIFAMVTETPELFAKTCCFRREKTSLGDFWSHVQDQSWFRRHPAAHPDRRHDLPWLVPVALFGDDCRIYKNEKITVWQISFVLSTEPAVVSRFVMAVLPDWAKVPDASYRDIEEALVWGFEAAGDGRWPTHDHKKKALEAVSGETRFAMAGKPLCAFEPRIKAAYVALKVPSETSHRSVQRGFSIMLQASTGSSTRPGPCPVRLKCKTSPVVLNRFLDQVWRKICKD